jgi:hypothetical protein
MSLQMTQQEYVDYWIRHNSAWFSCNLVCFAYLSLDSTLLAWHYVVNASSLR